MNDNAKAWVAALRSGDFKQCANMLSNSAGTAYCCLGVATELYRTQVGGHWADNAGGRCFRDEQNGCSDAVLTGAVQEWLGLTDSNGGITEDCSLTSLNDLGQSFDQIADVIESEPDDLFAVRSID